MGIETERFESAVVEDLICGICQDVLWNPLECRNCETNFCEECIEMWLKKSEECPNRCPVAFTKPHRIIKSMLGSLRVECEYKEDGCEALVNLENLEKHEELECKYKIVKCKYEECRFEEKRMMMEEHEERCEFRKIYCPECESEISFFELERHSCIGEVKSLIEVLRERLEFEEKKIKGLTNEVKSESQMPVHWGIECKGCKAPNIVGVRNICIDCEDFNLCWKCYLKIEHEHNNYVEIFTPGNHENIMCDGCEAGNLEGLRFKCKKCPNFGNFYTDFCLGCKVNIRHNHDEFHVWPPFCIGVNKVEPPSINCSFGKVFVREFVIENVSLEYIENPFLICTDGQTCSKIEIVSNNLIQVRWSLPPRGAKVLVIKEKVVVKNPGHYLSSWRFCTEQRQSIFGPHLTIEVFVTPK